MRMNKASFSEAEAFSRGSRPAAAFGAAARELGITQSTVSRRIAALEARIGKRLVERHHPPPRPDRSWPCLRK
jgi:DNA-binding MarR family transcriptional regulator